MELYSAKQKSEEMNSMLPVIKVELKRKIQFRRFSDGEEEIKPDWKRKENNPVSIILTHLRRVESSILTFWTRQFPIVRLSGYLFFL